MPQSREDTWTGSWLVNKLESHDNITAAFSVSPNRVRVKRTIGDEYEVATIALMDVKKSDLLDILTFETGVSFVTNISKNAYYHGSAIELAEENKIVIGDLGDLYRAMRAEHPRSYINPDVKFILRGLQQHTRISTVKRLDDRRYQLERIGLHQVVILALHDYDLSADTIRNGLDKYGHCDAILAANQNCRPTTLAKEAADSAGVQIYKWAELLGALNKPWN
ncbi:hypothetical protein [Anabaena sp. PCC 7108]|uniref:hypothetical protein n=1 Tax=Anabaena sp. PCC 7108 TaxID=163908 RepID=UPI00034C35C0|nr:hypothetical protein [Anabaena sp. PCC 7108]